MEGGVVENSEQQQQSAIMTAPELGRLITNAVADCAIAASPGGLPGADLQEPAPPSAPPAALDDDATFLQDVLEHLDPGNLDVAALLQQLGHEPASSSAPGPPAPGPAAPAAGEAEFTEGASRALTGDWAGALVEFASAVEADEIQPVYWHYLGVTLHQLGQVNRASAAVRKAAELGMPDTAAGRRVLEEAAVLAAAESAAVACMAAQRVADELLAAGQYSQAGHAYGQALAAMGNHGGGGRQAVLLHGRATASAMTDQWPAALADWDAAVAACTTRTQADETAPDLAAEQPPPVGLPSSGASSGGDGGGGAEADAERGARVEAAAAAAAALGTYSHYRGLARVQLGQWRGGIDSLQAAARLGNRKSVAALEGLPDRMSAASAMAKARTQSG